MVQILIRMLSLLAVIVIVVIGLFIVLGILSFIFAPSPIRHCGNCGHELYNCPEDLPVICPNCKERT